MKNMTRRCALAVAVLGLVAGTGERASANLIASLTDVPAVAPGSAGNALQVRITNTGPAPVILDAFSFGLAVSDPNILFTRADTSTSDPYLFGPSSTTGPVISTTPPPAGQVVEAGDFFGVVNSGTALGPGETAGLGRVLFDVGPGAEPGSVVPVVFRYLGLGGASPGATITGGSITIGPAAVPEPSTLALGGIGGLLALGYAWRRNRAARPARESPRRPDGRD